MMQDRFKSRFFHNPSGKYLNSQSLVYCNGCYEQVADRQFPNGTYKAYILTTYNTSEIIEEQCIGLKDKNGKLIYEGDIVEQEGKFYKVIFSYDNVASCGCCIDSFSGCGFVMEDKYGSRGDLDIYSELEVIGNIHENKDLLENKDD